MPHKLYAVHGSHPCAAVERALELKGLPYRRVELPPPAHMAIQRLRFGARTVPGLELEDGTRILGSTAILRRLDELAPEPRVFPADGPRRAAVEEAEAWGHDVWQPLARRVLSAAFARSPRAMASYQQGGSLPAFPMPVLLALAPLVTRLERAVNGANHDAARADLDALPAHLDRVDAWLADGLLGTDARAPNAADLQIASSSRLLLTVGDVVPAFDGRPAREHALAHFRDWNGSTPAGALRTP
jgi:glutathione S-transferase